MVSLSIRYARLSAIFGALAVALGAFGAHTLKPLLTDYQLAIFEKGVQYQFYHALALGLVAVMAGQTANRRFRTAGSLFVAGICLFSGSLYLLALRDHLPFPTGWLGPVTPLGGVCFIAGWVVLALAFKGRKV